MEKKSKLLTIGQFASLHGINKKTLMWYDEIGLFHPAFIHPENGYRYYSYHQSSILETILLLRELDVPIDEIQAFMKNRSAASMEQLLQEKNQGFGPESGPFEGGSENPDASPAKYADPSDHGPVRHQPGGKRGPQFRHCGRDPGHLL